MPEDLHGVGGDNTLEDQMQISKDIYVHGKRNQINAESRCVLLKLKLNRLYTVCKLIFFF